MPSNGMQGGMQDGREDFQSDRFQCDCSVDYCSLKESMTEPVAENSTKNNLANVPKNNNTTTQANNVTTSTLATVMENQAISSNMTQTGVESGPVAANNDTMNNSFQMNNSLQMIENTPGEPIKYYYGSNADMNDNSLMNYNYLNLDGELEEKTLEEAQKNALETLADKRVVKNDKGHQFLYDPNTGSLTAFNETRDYYNKVQKLANKLDFVEQSILNERSIDYKNPNEVRRKVINPSVFKNSEEEIEEIVEEKLNTIEEVNEVNEVEEVVEEPEESNFEVTEEPIEKLVEEQVKKPLFNLRTVLIILLVLVVISIIGLVLFKKISSSKAPNSFNIKFN